MRTKQVRISDEEREFQVRLDGIVRAYEDRIHEMIAVRDSLRKIRKCQYCGGRYYANGLCANCYNVLRRVDGDREAFQERRKRYGYYVRKSDNWLKKFRLSMCGEDAPELEEDALESWYKQMEDELTDEDKAIVGLIFRDGWSYRGCASVLNTSRGRIMSRINSMRRAAKRISK